MIRLNAIISGFFFSCFCVAQTADPLGNWKIIHFQTNFEGNENIISESELKNDNMIWDLELSETGKFRQTSNMSGNDKLESQEGAWSCKTDQLNLLIEYEGRKLPINYTYTISNGILELRRENPAKTMEIIVRFRKQ